MDIISDLSILSIKDNDILPYETISELFHIIYNYERQDIPFEELQQKFIDFYIYEANYECITRHINEIINITGDIIDISNKLDFIIMFFKSPFGTEYLYNIFKEITI